MKKMKMVQAHEAHNMLKGRKVFLLLVNHSYVHGISVAQATVMLWPYMICSRMLPSAGTALYQPDCGFVNSAYDKKCCFYFVSNFPRTLTNKLIPSITDCWLYLIRGELNRPISLLLWTYNYSAYFRQLIKL